MIYLFLFLLLFALQLLYFKIADKFNIIDKPNLRSSHTEITLRGGGIIFYLGALLYFFVSGFDYLWFFISTDVAADGFPNIAGEARSETRTGGADLVSGKMARCLAFKPGDCARR